MRLLLVEVLDLSLQKETYTDQLYSQCYFNQPGLINEEQAIAWKKVVDTVHEADAAIIVQLEHAGALSQGNRFSSHNLAPSEVQRRRSFGVLWWS